MFGKQNRPGAAQGSDWVKHQLEATKAKEKKKNQLLIFWIQCYFC